ncbi:HD domain-containing phosphohydrolase [Anaerosolibacter sp.]|uniref:HD domain-containing phosphohydrolase n=1 Tax=Anaerosolibacter sp. TaxID=1872527 RepID=UPI0039EFD515
MLIGDNKGDIYAHPDKSMLMGNIGEDPWFGKPLLNSNGTDLYDVNDGKQYVVSYFTVPKTGWKLVGIMEVDIGEMIIPIKNKVLVIGLVSAIITLVLGYALSLIVTRPVEKIMGVIHTISKGNMGVRVEIDSKDEFKILGDKFNEMLGEIEDLLDERNIHVQELVKKNQEIKLQNEEIRTYSEKSEAMNQELAELLHDIRKNYLSTVKALANSIEANDEYTRGHCERVRNISMEIVKAMGLDPNEANNLEFASVFHDIGKIGIPTEILNKESRLTFEEYENVKSHPRIGFDILAGVDFLNASREIIYQYHERVDGRGYPRGLKGAEINLSAKILAVADAYDAMTSARPYRKVLLTIGEAVTQLQEAKGVQFDNQVVDVLVEILDQECIAIDILSLENTAG